MQIYLNEVPITLEVDQCSLKEFLIAHHHMHAGFAAMLNQVFIPKAQYTTTMLADRDRINTILPNQGG